MKKIILLCLFLASCSAMKVNISDTDCVYNSYEDKKPHCSGYNIVAPNAKTQNSIAN